MKIFVSYMMVSRLAGFLAIVASIFTSFYKQYAGDFTSIFSVSIVINL